MGGRFSFDNITRQTGRFNVRFRRVWICVFIVLAILSAVAIPYTKVLYDVSDFLPDESMAATGLAVLKEEFDDKGNTFLIIRGVTEEQANDIADELLSVEGVASTVFEPSSSYKGSTASALIAITFEEYDSTQEAFDTMERLLDATEEYDCAFVGQSANSYFTKTQTEESILKVGIAIGAVILIMLLITSNTYFELVPMLITLGISVLLNMGTNYLFFGISYISNLVSVILQLALSIDYSVILMHRFTEERKLGLSPADAAVEAQRKGVPEILSSSLTTFAGMCALILMKLGIGVEIGLSLAKGVLLSLFTVLFLMPALLVLFASPLERSCHKTFLPSVVKPTRGIVRARKVIVPVFLVVIVLACVGQSMNTFSFDMNNTERRISSLQVAEDAGFGKMNTLVVVVPNDGDYAKQRETYAYVCGFDAVDGGNAIAAIELSQGVYLTDAYDMETMADKLIEMSGEDPSSLSGQIMLDYFRSVFEDYCEHKGLDANTAHVRILDILVYIADDPKIAATLPKDYGKMLSQLALAKHNLEGDRYVRMTFDLNVSTEEEGAFELIESLDEGLKTYYDEYYMTGESVVCHDMAGYFPGDDLRVNLFTLAFILIILLFTFRNVLLPIILTLTIQGGIWLNCVIPFLAGDPASFIGYLIISAIQMGATIDYAIVLTNRYRAIRGEYTDRYEAMAQAMNAVFPTVATSGIILMLTGFIMGIASEGMVSAMGTLLGFGAMFSILIVLFILPSFLLVTEKAVDKCGFRAIKDRLKRRK